MSAPSYPSKTVPQLILERAAQEGDRVAMRAKDLGVWHPITWRRYAERIRDFAAGLLVLGFEPGERVAVLGDNRPESLIADLAAQGLRGNGIILFPESLPEEVAYIVEHSEATVVVVQDQEQADKILEVSDRLGRVRRVVYWDPRGLDSYEEDKLIPFEDVERLGAQAPEEVHRRRDELIEAGDVDDVGILMYTSGTTGKPKGAMMTHRNVIAAIANFFAAEPVAPHFERLVFLPLGWAGERYFSTAGHALGAYVLNFAEGPQTLRHDIREIGPHHLLGAPRMWEDYLSWIQVRMEEASRLKRKIYDWAMPIGHELADRMYRDEPVPFGLRLRGRIANGLIFRPLRDHIGLLRAERVYSGGAALGPDIFRYYHAIGVPLKQIYGQTEVGITTVHWDQIKPETMGRPVPGVEIATTDSGEIVTRAESVFAGYLKDDDATVAAVRDGWCHSGDEGYVDRDGHVVVIDRSKNVSQLRGGDRFSPTFLENKLKFSRYIKEAVAFGDGREHVVALLNIDAETVGKWAEQRRIPYTTYTDLSQRAQVIELLRTEVAAVNEDLPEALRVRRFAVLHKELDADDEEITRTRKVRRDLVGTRYGFIVEGLYGGERQVDVDADVTYRDGRKARIHTQIMLNDIGPIRDEAAV